MKKFILITIAIIGIASLYSCKDDDENISMDLSGEYIATLTGYYQYSDTTYRSYNNELQVELKKVSETEYNAYSYDGISFSGPMLLTVYNNKRVKGAIYVERLINLNMDGEIRQDTIEGSFTGEYSTISNFPIRNGKFLMRRYLVYKDKSINQ